MKKSEFHILRPSLALEIGETESIILEKIAIYCKGSDKRPKGEEGKWIYNSITSWQSEHFPNWSQSKIYRTIKSLEEKGLIKGMQASFKKKENMKWYKVEEAGYKLLNETIESDRARNLLNEKNEFQNDEYEDDARQNDQIY